MGTSGTVTVRLPLDVLERFQKQAKDEGMTVSDVVRERLTAAEASPSVPHVADSRLEEMEKRLRELLQKAIKAAAASQFYAREGALETIDLVSIWSAQIGSAENTEARKEVASRLDADSQSFAEWWLKSGR